MTRTDTLFSIKERKLKKLKHLLVIKDNYNNSFVHGRNRKKITRISFMVRFTIYFPKRYASKKC